MRNRLSVYWRRVREGDPNGPIRDPWHLSALQSTGGFLANTLLSDISLREITQRLGNEQSIPTIATLYALYPTSFALTESPLDHWDPLPDAIARTYFTALVNRGLPADVIQMEFSRHEPNSSIRTSQRVSILDAPSWTPERIIIGKRRVRIDAIDVIHSDTLVPQQPAWKIELPRFEIARLKGVLTWCGSQVMLDAADNRAFVDTASHDGAHDLDFRHDTALWGQTEDCVIWSEPTSPSAEIVVLQDGLWLGYPLSNAWGHWFCEFMTRIALFAANCQSPSFSAAIPSNTPTNFVDAIRFIWPDCSIVRIPPGTKVLLDGAFAINAPVCYGHGIHPSVSGHMRQLSAEPLGIQALRKAIELRLSLRRGDPGLRLFLSRASATNGRANLDRMLSVQAAKLGYSVVDPSQLSVKEEFELALQIERATGLAGSQLLLTLLGREGSKLITVGHELLDHDSRGFAWCHRSVVRGSLEAVLGFRTSGSFLRSEQSMHRDFLLSDAGVEQWKYHLNS